MLGEQRDPHDRRQNADAPARLGRRRELSAQVCERLLRGRLWKVGDGILFLLVVLVFIHFLVRVELLSVSHFPAREEAPPLRLFLEDDLLFALGERLLHGLSQNVLQGEGFVRVEGLVCGRLRLRFGRVSAFGCFGDGRGPVRLIGRFVRSLGLFRAGEGDDGPVCGGRCRFFRRLRGSGRLVRAFWLFVRARGGRRILAVLGKDALERVFRIVVHAAGRIFQQQLGVDEVLFKIKVFLYSMVSLLHHRRWRTAS